MKKAIYTGAFRFPNKDAASQRVLGIAKALKQNDIDTIFCGWEHSPEIKDLQEDGIYRYSGFEYYSQNELDLKSKNIFEKIYRFLGLGNKTIKWIKNYLKNNTVDYVIVYNANSYFIYRLSRLSKRFNFIFICDCTEWNEGEHLPGGKFGIVNLDNNVRIRIIYPIIKNVVVISSYLNKYLQKKGCNTLIVPPLVDFAENKWKIHSEIIPISNDGAKKIIYAGDPGKKDLLKTVFTALSSINNNLVKFEFILLGIDEEVLKQSFFTDSVKIPGYIHCIGRVPQEEVPKYYQTCHFSILIREDKRYAQAGFPTKLVESVSSGVPIITNCTSDIQQYIKHGVNGFLLTDITVQTLIHCLEQIHLLSEDEMRIMSKNAKTSSRKNFDFQLFSNPIKEYLLAFEEI